MHMKMIHSMACCKKCRRKQTNQQKILKKVVLTSPVASVISKVSLEEVTINCDVKEIGYR